MARVLLGTDILVGHLRLGRGIPVPPEAGAYSSITRAELYAGRGTDERIVDDLLGLFDEVPVGRRIAEEAGRIRRHSSIALPDAIIASTAILTGRELLTRNVRHFESVPGLALHAAGGEST